MDTIYILWLRQMKKFRQSGVRMIISVVQPLVYLLGLGFGLNAIFKQAGHGSYIQFVVPGIIAQTTLFSCIFWGVNLIWDKQFGFLKEMLVAPVSRTTVMLGGALGGATVGVIQGVALFVIALLFGFHPYSWAMVGLTFFFLVLLSLAMVAFSSAIGAIVNDMQGFMAITNFLVLPLFFLSGAMFPLDSVPLAMKIFAYVNPLSYAIDAMRATLINQSYYGLWTDFFVMTGTLLLLLFFSIYRFKKIQA